MMARRPTLIAVLLSVWSLTVAGAALAGEAKVAVAANFTEPAKAIAARFKARTGHDAVLSFGSSGQFYTQIANGAPYEVLLSADVERPQKAEAAGLAVAGSRFTYATGRLVLFSRTPGLVDGRGAVLASGRLGKLAIADPKVAPYGQAAIETLTRLKRYDALKTKIVMGASITQAFQFVQTGAAELGFVALSQVVNDKGGSRWIVPAANHTPIEQQAVLLKTGVNNDAATAFLTFLKSAEAKAIIRRYGYEAR
ncbi:molybdate ABC transporter substrate-binding protein [Caulobacter sp. SL161]|uniref:molybdate ABC transporter substrate-binding protein n=1 Tax=Caulobacter sp. SL161 TaxID=2995156 RepID=UPI0022742CC1|nr:molybdate ABC transporter substrate-binding protein [Caulobacter sp. SL161]MCY1646378.1 molybdate ABC transporter substrate-binding protein [Caulobacter sp. SL161]